MGRARSNPEEIGAAAAEFLRFFGLVATGWMWVRVARAAMEQGGAENESRVATARFYASRILPQVGALATQIRAGAESVMALDASSF